MGRRVLVTGLGTYWGGRLAQALEGDPSVDVIVGLDTREPTVRLERTEYVRSDESYSILARIVRATRVDTVLHTFLVVDTGSRAAGRMHEINVIGTMNLCAAVTAPGSTVRTVVVKSSTMVYGAGPADPALFSETTAPTRPPQNRLERSLHEVEQYVADLATDHPEFAVSVLRFTNVLGPSIRTSLIDALDWPFVPMIAGFDPRSQFTHEDDVVRALRFAADQRLRGVFNVGGRTPLPFSEVIALVGKRPLLLPPVGTAAAARLLHLLGGPRLTPEMLLLLRYGRAVDTSKLERAGFTYRFDTPGTVVNYVEALRLRQSLGQEPEYRYEQDVESFFRHSPAVVRDERA